MGQEWCHNNERFNNFTYDRQSKRLNKEHYCHLLFKISKNKLKVAYEMVKWH